MSDRERVVRFTAAFWDALDAQLGDERGPNGEPSRRDFVEFELSSIIQIFATKWDELPPVEPDRPTERSLILPGLIVRFLAIHAFLVPDGEVFVDHIDIDLTPPQADG